MFADPLDDRPDSERSGSTRSKGSSMMSSSRAVADEKPSFRAALEVLARHRVRVHHRRWRRGSSQRCPYLHLRSRHCARPQRREHRPPDECADRGPSHLSAIKRTGICRPTQRSRRRGHHLFRTMLGPVDVLGKSAPGVPMKS